jgi:hypothetical protein
MNAGAEGEMPVRSSLKIEFLGMLVRLRIQVGGCQHGHDLVALLQPNAAKLDVLPHEAWFGKLHRCDEPQKFFHCLLGAAPVLLQPIAETRIFQELVDRAADQMRGRFVSRKQQQEDHRQHFVTADPPTFRFDTYKLSDQTLATALARDFQLLSQVAL